MSKRNYSLLMIFMILLILLAGCGSSAPAEPSTVPGTSIATTAPTAEPTQFPESTPAETIPPTTEAPTEDSMSVLLAILSDQRTFISEQGDEVYLREYLSSQFQTIPKAYTFVDFDKDGISELVIQTNSDMACHFVIHYNGTQARSFAVWTRAMLGLNADGTFRGSNGADYPVYSALVFPEDSWQFITLAEADYVQMRFTINGTDCSEAEFNAFLSDWDSKPDAVWITLEEEQPPQTEPMQQEASIPYLEQIPRADQSILSGPGYDYFVVGTVEVAGIYTIVEEVWDGEGNLWGRLKSGTGWVDLTDIRSQDAVSAPVSANYADDRLLQSGNYHHCIADTSEYMVQVAFRTQETVTNVQLMSLTFAGEGYTPSAVEYTLQELTPDKPLVADVAFPGDFSAYWLCFTDRSGTEHCYLLSMSLRNNSLIFEPYVPW